MAGGVLGVWVLKFSYYFSFESETWMGAKQFQYVSRSGR